MSVKHLKLTKLIILMIVVVLLSACSVSVEENAPQSGSIDENVLKVHFIDVGQGDSILITNKDSSMLIDAGNNGDSDLIVSYLKDQGIRNLDYVIGTHPHEDHIGGLDAVIDSFDIGRIYMPKITHTTKTFSDVIDSIKNKGLKINTPEVGSEFELGDAKAIILAPNANEYKELNDYSIVIKLKYGNNTFMFTGDAEGISEEEMMKNGLDLSADVLKLGHHGSHSSTTDDFLASVNPRYAVIMLEKDNDYGHPHRETMDKLKEKGIAVYRTDQSGSITAISDGESISFDTEPGDFSNGNDKEAGGDSQDNYNEGESNEETFIDGNGQGLIKGNINSSDEKIYHMPDGAYYDGVKPEQWFKTESEAQKAGFRRSKR